MFKRHVKHVHCTYLVLLVTTEVRLMQVLVDKRVEDSSRLVHDAASLGNQFRPF